MTIHGPQNIDQGSIILNGVCINDALEGGFTKYTQSTFRDLCTQKGIHEKTITQVRLDNFSSSSCDVLNNLIDDLRKDVDEA